MSWIGQGFKNWFITNFNKQPSSYDVTNDNVEMFWKHCEGMTKDMTLANFATTSNFHIHGYYGQPISYYVHENVHALQS